MADDTEIWMDIETIPYCQAKWPLHQVSNLGRIRVLPGGKIGNRTVTEPELRVLTLDCCNGYVVIKQGHTQIHYVHVLVLNQFQGPCPPEKDECRHLNGNRSDNHLKNLEWGTKKENYQDKVRHGTDQKGERNGKSKLMESDVINIRNAPWFHGINLYLAGKYKVHPSTISLIRSGKNWKVR